MRSSAAGLSSFPKGLIGNVDWFAAAMSVVAFIAVNKFKAEVLWVVLAGGLIGLGKTMLLSKRGKF